MGLTGVLKLLQSDFAFGRGIIQEFFKNLIRPYNFEFFFSCNEWFFSFVQDRMERLDQHKMDKLYWGWKSSDWRSWKYPNEYEIKGSEGGYMVF